MNPKYLESFTANLQSPYLSNTAKAVKTVIKIYSTYNKAKKLYTESTTCHSNS